MIAAHTPVGQMLSDKLGPAVWAIWQSSATRCWLLLYLATFFLALPALFGGCHHSLYSALHQRLFTTVPYLKQLQDLDKTRLEQARTYFDIVHADKVRKAVEKLAGTDQKHVDIVISMVSAAREVGSAQTDYVTQTIWAFLSQLTDPKTTSEIPYTLKMILCNGGTNPASNLPAVHLASYLPVVNMPMKREPVSMEDKLYNERLDYMLCLNESLKYSPRYILALEDDALPRHDMWNFVKYAISEKLEKHILHDRTVTDTSQIAYVKLFHPEYSYGFFRIGMQQKMEVIGLSMFLGTLLTLFHGFIRRQWYQSDHRELSCSSLIAWIVYLFLVLLAIGRPCLMELRRFFAPRFYIFVPAGHLNDIQAVLYKADGAEAIVNYFHRTMLSEHHPKDVLLRQVLVDLHLQGYQLFPNSFSHIGHKSTKGSFSADPY